MATDMSPENEQFLEQAIATGLFGSRGEALNAGVDLLKQRNQLISRLQESRRQLDEDDFVDLDEPGMHELFDTLRSRARQHSGK
jgi:Arc/MetJ-type ribon-helix-helix transcriptional regulator